MFSRPIEDRSKDIDEPHAVWLVVSGQVYPPKQPAWAVLVSALSYPAIGDFVFDFDSRIAHLGHAVLLRFLDKDLHQMITVPATIISRADDPNDQLSRVRVRLDKCVCGATTCQTARCFEAGTFVSQRSQLRPAA